jgi:hypothetical protein
MQNCISTILRETDGLQHEEWLSTLKRELRKLPDKNEQNLVYLAIIAGERKERARMENENNKEPHGAKISITDAGLEAEGLRSQDATDLGKNHIRIKTADGQATGPLESARVPDTIDALNKRVVVNKDASDGWRKDAKKELIPTTFKIVGGIATAVLAAAAISYLMPRACGPTPAEKQAASAASQATVSNVATAVASAVPLAPTSHAR